MELKSYSREAFIERFFAVLKGSRAIGSNISRREVFNLVNAEFAEQFGTPRYSDYQSFRVSLCRHMKKKKCR